MAAAVLLLISGFGSWAFLAGHGGAYLHLDCRSGVGQGELTVLVDGEKVYSRRLSASGIGSIMNRLVDRKHQTFETHIKVDGGVHGIAAAISNDEGVTLSEDALMIDVQPGETRKLNLRVSEDSDTPLSLRAD